jgi:hypothetical protein
MEDFGHFFKLGHTILTDKSVPCARPALIEAFRKAEEQDGNVKVFYDVYTTAANRSKEGLGAKEVREAIAAMQDDGKILKKILEVVAIPLSSELKEQVNSGDMLTFGAKDVTDEWAKSCTILAYARRHLVGKDMMKAILELVEIFDRRKEMLTENCNKRLRMFRTMITQALARWEKKYQTQITAPVLTEIFMAEAYCKNAKPCAVIAEFFRNMKLLKKYQAALQDFGEYKKSVRNLPMRSRAMMITKGGPNTANQRQRQRKRPRKKITKGQQAQAEGQAVTEFRSEMVDQVFGAEVGCPEIGCHRLSSTNSKS